MMTDNIPEDQAGKHEQPDSNKAPASNKTNERPPSEVPPDAGPAGRGSPGQSRASGRKPLFRSVVAEPGETPPASVLFHCTCGLTTSRGANPLPMAG